MELSISPGSPVRFPIRLYGTVGVREVMALLDTGASVLTISPEAAAALGYDLGRAPTVRVVTASGAADAPRILLSRVQLGEFAIESVPAICLDVSGVGASCLLGLSALARLNVFLDNKSGTLTITDP